jgi:periplasmic protein CpxP/Spy
MMKKLLIVLGLALTVATGAWAQPPQGGGQGRFNFEERQKQEMETMKKELSLTPDQVKKVEALNAETNQKTRELFEASAGDREGNREKFRTLREEHTKKLNVILTPDQAKKWEEIQEKLRAERRANRPGGPGGPGGERGGQRGGQR